MLNLPKLNSQIIEGVVTSPPYCNRYDYTRTYALEMNYLGLSPDNDKINRLLNSITKWYEDHNLKF